MSKKYRKFEYGDGAHSRSDGRSKLHLNLQPTVDTKHKENVVIRLAELFLDSFDLELIQSVAQTCQWDYKKSTEALIVLGGTTQPKVRTRRVNSLVDSSSSSNHKTKSLPSTLKGRRSQSGRLSDSSTQSMPNGLRAHPAYFSNDSLESGQVWQRHYKSKPQSPGLLTMIPPSGKDSRKHSKPSSSRSSSQASLVKGTPEAKQTSTVILRIEKLIQNNVKVMVLLRGMPGSGKTHLAHVLVKMVAANDRDEHIFSTDDYFVMMGRGVYTYDSNKVSLAHNWNQKRVSEALRRATNPVIVDNTNTQAWEMQPYVVMGVQYGYLIEVLEPVTPWRTREAELAKRNVHGVPREKIRQMLDRFEPGWTGDKLLNLFQLKYQHCGAAHVSPEVTGFSNSPLTQHRQHGQLEQPEKPKRKKVGGSKKDRRQVVGVEINNSQEQQLEELNKLFAEYGKTIDPESRQKVIEAGVPITEVVSRIRKLQGTLLPLPGMPPVISEEGPMSAVETPAEVVPASSVVAPTPDYLGLNRLSPTDSVEPDTMSSSEGSETSDCDSDSDPEPLRRYLDFGGHFVEGEDQWEDEEEAKSDTAVNGRQSVKCSGFVTSSQEELSIIDYQLSTPAGSSQDELSLLEFERGSTPNGTSSSSEEPKTELSTLQDSIRDVLLRSAAVQRDESNNVHEQLMRDIASQTGSSTNLAAENKQLEQLSESAKDIVKQVSQLNIEDKVIESDKKQAEKDKTEAVAVDLNDSLLAILKNRFESTTTQPEAIKNELTSIELSDSIFDILKKKLISNGPDTPPDVTTSNVDLGKIAKSPDLEEIPLPCLPPPEEPLDRTGSLKSRREGPKLETIIETLQSPPDTEEIPIQKTPEKGKKGIFQNVDMNWSSIPITSSMPKVKPELPARPKFKLAKEVCTMTIPSDFELWRSNLPNIKILNVVSRTINPPDASIPVRNIAAVAMFDKSTMTSNEETTENIAGLEDLKMLFPDVPVADLADLLEKCQNDVQWVAELITDSSSNMHNIAGSIEIPEELVDAKIGNIIADGKKTIKRRKDRKGTQSEFSQLLKKEFESSIQISTEHYSDHVLYIKKLRDGEFSETDPVPLLDEAAGPSTENMVPVSSMSSIPDVEAEVESHLSMPLDSSFFQQLISRFGDANVCPPITGYKPVIKVPESLARTLYWLWVETLNEEVAASQENDDVVKADALLAAALQEQEIQDRQPNMQELIDMDFAQNLALKDKEKYGEKRRETLAAVLSRNLLLDKYPHLDKSKVLQVFHNEDCSLQRTCATLEALYGPPKPNKADTPNIALQQAMLDNVKEDYAAETRTPLIIVKETAIKKLDPESNVLVVDPSSFRWKTQMLNQKRNDYLRLGQAEMAKKNYSTASYFFQEASRLKDQIQETQATSIWQDSDETKRLPIILDLHYLFRGEAVQYVDLFLDQHISRLPSGRLDLFLITGRGQRSPSGLSRIKPVVIKRLTDRQLTFVEDNPGMLRVTIHPNDLLSTAL